MSLSSIAGRLRSRWAEERLRVRRSEVAEQSVHLCVLQSSPLFKWSYTATLHFTAWAVATCSKLRAHGLMSAYNLWR